MGFKAVYINGPALSLLMLFAITHTSAHLQLVLAGNTGSKKPGDSHQEQAFSPLRWSAHVVVVVARLSVCKL